MDVDELTSIAGKQLIKHDNKMVRKFIVQRHRTEAVEKRVAELEAIRKKENGRIIELLKENSALQVRVAELEEAMKKALTVSWTWEANEIIDAALNKSK